MGDEMSDIQEDDIDRAIKTLAEHFSVVVLYCPGDDVLAMHWAVSDEALSASIAKIISEEK